MDSADLLRNELTVSDPDPRMQYVNQGDFCRAIQRFELIPGVSEQVKTHFETAKNLYLYSWNVYRFHMVAEHYVCSTLEMAARERLVELGMLGTEGRPLGLTNLLQLAKKNKLLSNDRFLHREEWAKRIALNRFRMSEMSNFLRQGSREAVIDETNVRPSKEDLEFNWLDHFIQYLPTFRNLHAHGSDHLSASSVGWTFQIVTELVNQLYQATANEVL